MTPIASSRNKVPLYSVLSERRLLQSLLQQPALIGRVRKIISSGDDFFRTEHGKPFDVLIRVCGVYQAADADELIGRLDELGLLADAGGGEALRAIANEADHNSSPTELARVIADKARMRRLVDTLTNILDDAYYSDDGYERVLARAKSRVAALDP